MVTIFGPILSALLVLGNAGELPDLLYADGAICQPTMAWGAALECAVLGTAVIIIVGSGHHVECRVHEGAIIVIAGDWNTVECSAGSRAMLEAAHGVHLQ